MEWITKKVGRTSNKNNDVSITINNSLDRELLRIGFKNTTYLRISTTGYVKFAEESGRLYFGESNECEGFKFTNFNENRSSCAARTPIGRVPNYERWLGDYTLRFDKKLNLYFVDLPE